VNHKKTSPLNSRKKKGFCGKRLDPKGGPPSGEGRCIGAGGGDREVERIDLNKGETTFIEERIKSPHQRKKYALTQGSKVRRGSQTGRRKEGQLFNQSVGGKKGKEGLDRRPWGKEHERMWRGRPHSQKSDMPRGGEGRAEAPLQPRGGKF